ncbi:solute carrier family 35 member E3 [Parasteatoda tepidariorum]|uniref:solute carrier family 35 member E3 n=1 Tax=Parasteatoda tepidariorum TaxID=114398 RepID=UPI001C71DD5C|nr:solute carrier family 35 member E3 [Parasteatoda tepidariorum]
MCFQHEVPLCLAANLILSVSIVLINKIVYVRTQFPNITLTFIHFVITSLGIKLCEKCNIFQVKRVPLLQIVPLAISFCGFVVFTNLSLQFNTVGTYQILKTLTMPTIMLIQTFFYSRTFCVKIKLTLVPISLGVFLNSAYDIKFNVAGTVYALIGVMVTSFYQVWVGEKQREFQMNSMQLLYYQAPLSSLLLLFCVPMIEPPWAQDGLFNHNWSLYDLTLVLISGLIAFSVNLSIYWIIGNTSAVTYNVVGQLKFCLTLLGGYLIFMEPILPIQFLGILITMIGVSLYAYLKSQDHKAVSSLPYVLKK